MTGAIPTTGPNPTTGPAPMTLPIPVIETDRLILRGHRMSDFETFAAFVASDRLTYIGGPGDRFAAWRKFLAQYGQWAMRGYGMWMLESRATEQPIGHVGIVHHETWPEPELGWSVFADGEGHGYAYEAAYAARAHAATHFGMPRLISQIHPDNARSRALAERLGARVEKETTLMGDPCLIYRHPDPREGPDAA